jgi:16S rRNA (uracil1498-N3)-methyltransferase
MVDRFFLPDGFDSTRSRVELDDDEREHALQSRRVRVGDRVELLNGDGWCGEGIVAVAQRKSFVVELERCERREREGRPVHLAICVPRATRMDALVDAATQLGVEALRPVIAERAVSAREDTSVHRLERWRRIAREAAKQSGEPFVPEIAPPVSLESLLTEPFEGLRLLLHPDPNAPALASRLTQDAAAVRILVGPEGGFTPEEARLAESHGEARVRLGRSILRIEMAAIAAAVLARLVREARRAGRRRGR